uniref:Uncharacterized protein n=1 Tax=viral metagenome TaxID=1070528 RepID=A0A6C0BCU5_9ZZZZ
MNKNQRKKGSKILFLALHASFQGILSTVEPTTSRVKNRVSP